MILIVDDDPEGRETLRDALEDEGYAVVVARDGHAALRQLLVARPALMVLDLLMPGMNGNTLFEVMQRSAELAKVPVVVTTSDPSRAPRGVPTLAKPLQLDRLLALIALACR
jgi:DNA-binding response OmpR family regulator